MRNSLHIDACGSGPTIVLVHGWGFHGGIWDPLAERLAQHFQVIRPDLPGHGYSGLPAVGYGLDELVDAMVAQVAGRAAGPAIWVGWSLGSLIAMQAAVRHPDLVRGVVTLAGTPCFTATDDWRHGVPGALIDRFGDELTSDWKLTLRRFLALQGQGCDPALVRRVREIALQRLPAVDGLRGALSLLRNQDLRGRLGSIRCPLLVINGVKDNLVPVQGTRAWMQQVPDARLVAFHDAGHMPFLSHPAEVEQALRGFASDPALRPAAAATQRLDRQAG